MQNHSWTDALRSAEYNRRVWLHIENDPLPSEGNSIADLHQTCAELICSGDLPREESVIRDFVYESAPNMATQDKNEVVRIVLKEEDVPTKTISWRIIGTLSTLIIAWIVTGDPLTGFKISVVEFFTKMLLYYYHEKVWFKIKFGLK